MKTNKINYIPFSKLFVSAANVRVVSPTVEADAKLMASILADGVLQNLAVVARDDGYEVIAGGRRFAAVGKLVESGKLESSYEIPCLEKDAADATAVSLAENICREDMHPADVFMAYRALKDQGISEKEIAKKFGDSAQAVKKLLRLSSVAPELVAAFRAGEMDLDLIMAFTVSTDTKAQLACWQEVSRGNPNPRQVRRMLLQSDVDVNDSRVKFVTVKAYKAAGGKIATDLFEENEYVLDEELLDSLVEKKLGDASAELVAAGWKWVEVETGGDDDLSLYSFKRIEVERVNPPAELVEELAQAEKDLQLLNDEDWSPTYNDREYALEQRILVLTNRLDGYCEFTPEQMAGSGCLVSYSEEGELLVYRGYMNHEDRVAAAGSLDDDDGDDDNDDEDYDGDADDEDSDDENESPVVAPVVEEDPTKYSQALVMDMNNYYRQGLRAELAKHEALAYDLLVFTLADQLLGNGRSWESALDIRPQATNLTGVDIGETGAAASLELALNSLDLSWVEIKNSAKRFEEFCLLSSEKKSAIMTYCVAITSLGEPKKTRSKVLAVVEEKTNFTLKKYWQPTAANFFSRIDKTALLSIGCELTDAEFEKKQTKAKKSELADYMEKMPEVQGWLPKYLQ